ncbi:MAG: inositol monophosphatase family protein [Candidatus Eisenbacteria bacterium]
MIEFVRRLAAEAAAYLCEQYDRVEARSVDFKGRRDLVTAADRHVEALLAGAIERRFPEDAILGEESARKPGRSGRVWIVDPLDGTTNFVHGHPLFCVSIALAEGDAGRPDPERTAFAENASGFFRPEPLPTVVLAVVHAPALGEVFWAARGGGAWFVSSARSDERAERRLQVRANGQLQDALVATGFAYRRNEVANTNLENFSRLALRARGIRRGGSAALDLSYVAAGRFDAFWELYLKPWDVAAGLLLVEEAGGRVSDFQNRPWALEGTEVLASNGTLHEQVRGLLEGADPAWARTERSRLNAVRGKAGDSA